MVTQPVVWRWAWGCPGTAGSAPGVGEKRRGAGGHCGFSDPALNCKPRCEDLGSCGGGALQPNHPRRRNSAASTIGRPHL